MSGGRGAESRARRNERRTRVVAVVLALSLLVPILITTANAVRG